MERIPDSLDILANNSAEFYFLQGQIHRTLGNLLQKQMWEYNYEEEAALLKDHLINYKAIFAEHKNIADIAQSYEGTQLLLTKLPDEIKADFKPYLKD